MSNKGITPKELVIGALIIGFACAANIGLYRYHKLPPQEPTNKVLEAHYGVLEIPLVENPYAFRGNVSVYENSCDNPGERVQKVSMDHASKNGKPYIALLVKPEDAARGACTPYCVKATAPWEILQSDEQGEWDWHATESDFAETHEGMNALICAGKKTVAEGFLAGLAKMERHLIDPSEWGVTNVELQFAEDPNCVCP